MQPTKGDQPPTTAQIQADTDRDTDFIFSWLQNFTRPEIENNNPKKPVVEKEKAGNK